MITFIIIVIIVTIIIIIVANVVAVAAIITMGIRGSHKQCSIIIVVMIVVFVDQYYLFRMGWQLAFMIETFAGLLSTAGRRRKEVFCWHVGHYCSRLRLLVWESSHSSVCLFFSSLMWSKKKKFCVCLFVGEKVLWAKKEQKWKVIDDRMLRDKCVDIMYSRFYIVGV